MKPKHILIAIFVTAIWGFNFIFAKIGVREISPLLLCGIRFFFASIPAIFLVPFPKTYFKEIALYGLVMFGLQFALIFSSFPVGMTAGMASLLMQTQIFFSVFLAVILFKERPTRWQILGALFAFSGIILVMFHLDSTMTVKGFALVMGGAIAWGLGNLLSKVVAKVNMFALIAWGSLIACPPLFLLSYLIEGQATIAHDLEHFSWTGFIALTYIIYASTWLGYGLWNWLLRLYPVSTVVPFTLLIPIFGMLGSVIFLHESFTAWKLTAAILVVSGLGINLIAPRLVNAFNEKHQLQKNAPSVPLH